MTRLIDAFALISEMQDKCCGDCDLCIYCRYENANYFCGLIEEAPTVERPHGEWIKTNDYVTCAYGCIDYVKCSCCKNDSLEEGDYCPNCGADMRGDQYDSNVK